MGQFLPLNCPLIDGGWVCVRLTLFIEYLACLEDYAIYFLEKVGILVHQVIQYDTNSQPMPSVSLRRNMGSEFSCMIKEAKVLGTALGVPFLDGYISFCFLFDALSHEPPTRIVFYHV